jgi:hypothetical protein
MFVLNTTMDPNFSQFHQIIYRKYSLLVLGAILTILLFVFCYDAYSAYLLIYGKNTYLRGSR